MVNRRLIFVMSIVGVIVALYIVTTNLLDRLWDNVPIVFYGRLVDQDGNGISNAVLSGYVQAQRRLSIPVPGADTSVQWTVSAETDDNGNFVIRGGHARSLHIQALNTRGFLDFRGGNFYYGTRGTPEPPYHADPHHPEEFRVWKLRGTEHLDEKYCWVDIKRDGRPYVIDLVKALSHEGIDGGDLRVSIEVPEKNTSGQAYEYVFKMEAIDGGVVPGGGPFPYEAPADGYRPSLTYEITSGDINGEARDKELRGFYYIKSRDGRVYASFMIAPNMNSKKMSDRASIQLRYRVNSNGSRVLEP